MKLADIVTFRRDLLFTGAVQIGWLETNPELAEKAAAHYAFHGPAYHGVVQKSLQAHELRPVDTAKFTLDLLERIAGKVTEEPIGLAVAGYGTGKSHLAVTLASLLSAPDSSLAQQILANLCSVDTQIGEQVRQVLDELGRPFLVVAINGMRDFDLAGEIIRQILAALKAHGLDTSALEDLRPRFRHAVNFVESLFEPLRDEFEDSFGKTDLADIVDRLERQDEETFHKVSVIYEHKMGTPLRAAGQESLDDFVRVARETYCGRGKPFAGIVILFDEFGRYLEFAVQRPQVAGPGALQQLFESVQANTDGVFLQCFIQYELRAYVARVAPELRDDLQRYVTRYDVVHKTRLSTNLETLIANLLQPQDPNVLAKYIAAQGGSTGTLQRRMKEWYPALADHALWADTDTFKRVIQEGCWPLHPLSTWLLYRLASAGRSLQQRSALSLLADAYSNLMDQDVPPDFSIAPVDLCGEGLVDEFLTSEKLGQQGASAHAYRSVLDKYGHQLSDDEVRTLKAVLLMAKTHIRVASKEDYGMALAEFIGRPVAATATAVESLESEKGALSWNEALRQYEIVSDAVPRTQFLSYLKQKVSNIPAEIRSQIFSENYARWFPELETFPTDFGALHDIATKEWNYRVSFANVHRLPNQIEYAFRNWMDARGVDQAKGQLIYCYVGSESDLERVRGVAKATLRACLEKAGLGWEMGAPIAVMFLHDEDGSFGTQVAEYWTLQEEKDTQEAKKYANFILDRENNARQNLLNLFESLSHKRHLVFATDQDIPVSRLAPTLTSLFEAVYPEHIPFPFDGFSTVNGNAAKDCSLFIRELFLGRLDREWITVRAPKQRNRAFAVLHNSWNALDDTGAIRPVPGNPPLRRVIERLDDKLTAQGDPKPLNLGQAIRELCAPPYGCSIASAGLILALFACARKKAVELFKGGQVISVERWLQTALPRNYLELSILDDTVIVQISEEAVGEWNRLLNEWEIEKTHSGRVGYWQKSAELAQRLPVPQPLYYQHENLGIRARESQQQLREYGSKLNKALEQVYEGVEREDLSKVVRGAAGLAELRAQLELEEDLWTDQQLHEVEGHEGKARVEVQQRFTQWLPRLKADSLSQLGEFLRHMEKLGKDLSTLGLREEKAALEQHTRTVEDSIRFLDEVHHLHSDVTAFIHASPITGSTPLRSLRAWLDQVERFEHVLGKALQRKVALARDNLQSAAKELQDFKKSCREQIDQHKKRALYVYNAEISSSADIHSLKAEVTTLRQLFDGETEDVADLDMIHRQLSRVEADYLELNNPALNNSDFKSLLKRCAGATKAEFGVDEPPLDNAALYKAIAREIREKRRRDAQEWMKRMPSTEVVRAASAQRALELKTSLQAPPRYLSDEQMDIVRERIEVCDRRLDELEVDGLVARYQKLSEAGKRQFLKRIGGPGDTLQVDDRMAVGS